MALNTNTNKNSNKLYILKVRTKDADKQSVPVHFEVFEKKSVDINGKTEEKWATATTTRNVSGDLSRVELGEVEYEGEKSPTVKLTIVDNAQKESYLLDLRYNIISRSLFNGLFNLKSFDNIEIGVYQTKPKTKDGKSFAAISLKQNGERVDWKFKKEEIPPVEIVKVGKKGVSNFDNMNEFFLKNLEELSIKVRANKPKVSETPTAPIPAVSEEEPSKEEEGLF